MFDETKSDFEDDKDDFEMEDDEENDPDFISSQEARNKKVQHLNDFLKASGKKANLKSQLTKPIDETSAATKYRYNDVLAAGIESMLETTIS